MSNTNSGNNLYQAMFLNSESALGSSLSDFASLRRRRHRSGLHSNGGSSGANSVRPSTRRVNQYEEATSTTSVVEISWLRRRCQRSPTVDRLPRPPPEDFEDDDDDEEEFYEEEASDLPLYNGSVSIAKDKDSSQRTLMRSSGSLSLELSGLLDFADSFHDAYGVSSLTCDLFLPNEHPEEHDHTSTTVLDEDYSSTNGDGAYSFSCSSGARNDLLTTSMMSKSPSKLNYIHEMATPTIKNTVTLSNDIEVFEDNGQQNDDDFEDSGSLSDSLHASLNASMFSISARQLWSEQEEDDEDGIRSEYDDEEYETSFGVLDEISQRATATMDNSIVYAEEMDSMAALVGSTYDDRYSREEEEDDEEEKDEEEEENQDPLDVEAPLKSIEFEYGDNSFYTQLTNSIISSAGSFPDEPLCVRGGNRDESEGSSPVAPPRKSPPSDHKANSFASPNSSRRSLHRRQSSSLSLLDRHSLSSPGRST